MKKLLILCFALMISAVAVAGSIAFFTDSVTANDNVIVAGSIDVEQHEQEREWTQNADGSVTCTLRTFSQEQSMYPCMINESSLREPVVVGNHTVQMYTRAVQNFRDKIVTVENAGKSPAYLRTFVAVPAAVNNCVWLHLDCNTAGWTWSQPDKLKNVSIDGIAYDIYVATHTDALPAGSSTAPSLLGVYMDGRVSNDNDQLVYVDENNVKHPLGDQPSLSIMVTTEAAQTLTFADAQDALSKTFGNPDVGHHPWAKQ